MTFATTYNLWSIAGMVYALAGAALLCNAVFSIPSGFAYATPPLARHDARRLNGQWLDMRVGSSLLVVGFFLQMTGGAVGTATLNVPAVFVLLALALFAGYYALAKDLIADRLVGESEMEIDAPLLARPSRTSSPEVQAAPAAPAAAASATAELSAAAVIAHIVEIVEAEQDSAA